MQVWEALPSSGAEVGARKPAIGGDRGSFAPESPRAHPAWSQCRSGLMTRGCTLAAGLHLLQQAQFALFQPKHMDQPAHRVGHIGPLVAYMLLNDGAASG